MKDHCRGCGVETTLYYGLCLKCRVLSPNKRPLNPKYRRISKQHRSRVQNREGQTGSFHLEHRKYLVCGCDYMEVPLEAKPHRAVDCPNAKVVEIARGHDEGGKGR